MRWDGGGVGMGKSYRLDPFSLELLVRQMDKFNVILFLPFGTPFTHPSASAAKGNQVVPRRAIRHHRLDNKTLGTRRQIASWQAIRFVSSTRHP